MTELDAVFAALANTHRREIIAALALQPRSITELAEMRRLSLPAIHKHIAVLEAAGLLLRKKVGRTNFLALGRLPLRDLQAWVMEFNPFWGSDAETLENYVQHLNEGTA
jgi:DNA-binding transcriptional ArsR family regulator